MSKRGVVTGVVGLTLAVVGTLPAYAADVAASQSSAYTYFNLEGGYVHLDGGGVQAFRSGPDETSERFFDAFGTYYGRAELGRAWGTGTLNGIGAYIQGWKGSEDLSETDNALRLGFKLGDDFRVGEQNCNIDGQNCARGDGDLDRSMFEAGLRFFHEFSDTGPFNGVSLGFEPFVAFIDEDTNSQVSTIEPAFPELRFTRSSNLDAQAYGSLLAFDGRYNLAERTMVTMRVAAGAYYLNADSDTDWTNPPSVRTGGSLSSDSVGFRGQLALGIEQMLTEKVSIGIIGRLDYWSDYPSMDWTDAAFNGDPDASDDSIAHDDLLALSVGARLSLRFGD
jgi:hypothetical protein